MKVSVLLICYNQERYIESALDSILCQKTDFAWELLIGDDASRDRTAEIIAHRITNCPVNCTVRPILRSTNQGASRNLFDLIRHANGEYITVLEGDDYWLDQSHLQALADYLDANPSLAGVSYRRERRLNGVLIKYDPDESVVGSIFSLEDYCNGKRFSAMACMFRNIYSSDYDGYEFVYTGARNACDQVMCYTILFSGDIFIMDKILGVYRISSGGYCSQVDAVRRHKDYLIQNRRISAYYEQKKAITDEICMLHAEIMKNLLKSGDIDAAVQYYREIPGSEKKGVLTALGGIVLRNICGRK